MRILALETSTLLGGVAILDETEGLVTEVRLNVRTTHSETLMTVINSSLQQAGVNVWDIDLFGVAIGPGSFTGLRIGLSTVKGFCYATGKPLVAVPSLEACAWNFPYSRHSICVMFDARKGEVYSAVFRWDTEGFERVLRETSVRPKELLMSLEGEVVFAGEGAVLYKELITDVLGSRAHFAPPQWMVPAPSNVASLGLAKAKRGEFSDPAGLVPFYIRKSEAEIELKEPKGDSIPQP
jgi:tRNA threonylcarbamoyladenosine biosynthesis protein TsaB